MDLHNLGDRLAGTDLTSREGADAADGASQKAGARARKRTKTGCLTCRKRRIKCGEERPICRNCVKSKRICEGYSQRVTFRDPNSWHSSTDPADPTLLYHNGGMPGTAIAGERQPPPPPLNLSSMTDSISLLQASPHISSAQGSAWTYDGDAGPLRWATAEGPLSPLAPHSAGPFVTTAPGGAPFYAQFTSRSLSSEVSNSDTYFQPNEYLQQRQSEHEPQYARRGSIHETFGQSAYSQASHNSYSQQYASTMGLTHAMDQDHTHATHDQYHHTQSQMAGQADLTFPKFTASMLNEPWARSVEPEMHNVWTEATNLDVNESTADQQARRLFTVNDTLETPPYESKRSLAFQMSRPIEGSIRSGDFLRAAAIQSQDDDYFDVESSEEELLRASVSPEHDLSLLAQVQQRILANSREGHTSATFQGVLDHYYADLHASPLKNELTALVFCHFITTTSSHIGIFERYPGFEGCATRSRGNARMQRNLWAHDVAMMALSNRGLLQAILALSSLHLANLQGASTTPSIKHYMYAIKSVHKAVGCGKKRHHVTTLAATLLLGYYEVMTADHAKWCSHLSGARQLLLELDFQGMRKVVKESSDPTKVVYGSQLDSGGYQAALDEHLMSTLHGGDATNNHVSGRELNSELGKGQSGQISEGEHLDQVDRHVPPLLDDDLHNLFQDLWWWFGRQDAFQSIVSGNRLLMPYGRWRDCLPRARIGQSDSVYGTHDHTVLLLARIADFSAKDRRRKLAVIQARGGQWRPPIEGDFRGLGKLGPPDGGQKPPRFPVQQPPFMGMAPSADHVHVPMPYHNNDSGHTWADTQTYGFMPPLQTPSSNGSTEREYAAAIKEWLTIRSALETLGSNYGPQFQAIETSYASSGRVQSPFGQAICFQKLDVAAINAMYHMLRIIHYRSHPDMPPASMIAAGVSATFTNDAAMKIGQIAAGMFASGGLVPVKSMDSGHGPLDAAVGGILCEVSMPLYFVGVQLRDAAQRAWLVDHLRELEIRTGFATAGMIGHGCETAWKRAGEAGAGPPYRCSGHWARRDALAEQSSGKQRPTWAQGVRGFSADPRAASELGSGETTVDGHTVTSQPHQASQSNTMFEATANTSVANMKADMLRHMHVFGDSKVKMHWATGLTAPPNMPVG